MDFSSLAQVPAVVPQPISVADPHVSIRLTILPSEKASLSFGLGQHDIINSTEKPSSVKQSDLFIDRALFGTHHTESIGQGQRISLKVSSLPISFLHTLEITPLCQLPSPFQGYPL